MPRRRGRSFLEGVWGIGETGPVPFITAFATPVLIPEELEAVTEALDAVHFRPSLLSDLVSKDGFVELRPQGD